MYAASMITAAQPYVEGMTTGRAWSLVGAFFGLAGVAAGVLSMVRAARGSGRGGVLVSLVSGGLAMVVGGWIVAVADGGPGTGAGIVGGYVCLVLGLVAIGLGTLSVRRTRRAAR